MKPRSFCFVCMYVHLFKKSYYPNISSPIQMLYLKRKELIKIIKQWRKAFFIHRYNYFVFIHISQIPSNLCDYMHEYIGSKAKKNKRIQEKRTKKKMKQPTKSHNILWLRRKCMVMSRKRCFVFHNETYTSTYPYIYMRMKKATFLRIFWFLTHSVSRRMRDYSM